MLKFYVVESISVKKSECQQFWYFEHFWDYSLDCRKSNYIIGQCSSGYSCNRNGTLGTSFQANHCKNYYHRSTTPIVKYQCFGHFGNIFGSMGNLMILLDRPGRVALGTSSRYSGTLCWANRRLNYSNRLLTSPTFFQSHIKLFCKPSFYIFLFFCLKEHVKMQGAIQFFCSITLCFYYIYQHLYKQAPISTELFEVFNWSLFFFTLKDF